jgi:hypothetical protein
VFQPPHRSTVYHHFSNIGFSGDIDDLEEDDIEKEMAGNDDWMFQTFQKATSSENERRVTGGATIGDIIKADENMLERAIPSPE